MKRRKEKQRSELALASKPQLADAKLQHASCERREKKNNASKTVCEAMLESMEGAEGRAVSRNVYLVHTYRGGYQKKCGRGGIFYGVPYRLKYNSLMDKAT